MPRFFVKNEQIKEKQIIIIGEDVKHIKNVVRKQIGDNIEICNQESGIAYNCQIIKIEENQITNQIVNEIKSEEEHIKVDIFQGLPKADKMELIIQKSVELGANSIIPVKMERCIVKLDGKDEIKKIERWQKIAESAAKQCGRNNIPQVKHLVNIKDISSLIKEYDAIIVAYENEKEISIKSEIQNLKLLDKKLRLGIVIGPEGGLDLKEVEQMKQEGAKIVTLGTRILRTETVALNILSILMYEFDIR